MIALVQRVSEASVHVGAECLGRIGAGLVALVAIERGDDAAAAARLVERVLGYRVFPDAEGRMNRSLADVAGGLLAVPQFTLAADTNRGTRPGFSRAASPADGERMFERFVTLARSRHARVETGRFGAHMALRLVNDGPVTFWLQAKPQGE